MARWLLRGTASAVALLGLAVAAPASAHVTLIPSTTRAGAPAVLQFAIGHGCDGSATSAVTIRIPQPITAVTPTRHPLWDVEQEVVPVDPPVVDAHGGRLTERVAAVTFRAEEPLPEGERDVLEIALVLPADGGTTLSFPTIQTCEQGESAWLEVPAGGQDPEQLDRPAPTMVVTAGDPGADGAASAVDTLTAVRADTEPSGRGDAEAPLLALGAFGLGLLALLVAVAALARQRRRS